MLLIYISVMVAIFGAAIVVIRIIALFFEMDDD